jgi:hypothetical protein
MSDTEKAAARQKAHKPKEPRPAALARMPETPTELFEALAGTIEIEVDQPVPDGNGRTRKHHYVFPWPGWTGWKDARQRLHHFESYYAGKVVWAPFNDSESNDGPMTLNAFPGRAFIERVTNAGDACLELKALTHTGLLPSSPAEAVGVWYGLKSGALATGMNDEDSRQLAKESVSVRTFVGQDPSDPKDCIIDARDLGIGLTADEMPNTILSLNRGLKKNKLYLTGKHGQGASSTYQYSDLTFIASRKNGTKVVAFTLVEATWEDEDGNIGRTPTYRYLTLDGEIPAVIVKSDDEFLPGTLVRHIGYNADFKATEGDKSMYGLLMRSLAQPLFPIWLEQIHMRGGTAEKIQTFAGYRRYGRQIRGTVNLLERAWNYTLNPPSAKAPQELSKILHRSSEVFKMGPWDFGGRTGVADLGQVKITYWVADPNDRMPQDALKNWVDPEKTVIFTLDGQTHAEESRAIVTGQNGAKLWAVGKYMVVQIDCDGLDPRAKYEMFTSTREHVKDTPIRDMIMDELARRLRLDKKLGELNGHFAAAGVKKSDSSQNDSISALLKKYLKKSGLDFEKFLSRIRQWKEVEEEKEISTKREQLDPPPIEAQEPPTFIRWRFKSETARMHPGQRYSWVFETDAPSHYWNDADPAHSKIRVLASGVQYIGGGEMKGGRARCHFRCPEDVKVGTKGMIQAQLEWQSGAAKTAMLPVEVIAKPEPKRRDEGEKVGKDEEDGEPNKQIKVTIKKRDFSEVEIPILQPKPITREDNAWNLLQWGLDAAYVGFSIRSTQGKIQLYYNAEFPPLLEMKRRMSKRSLEDTFIQRFELKLVLHTVFTLNYDFTDEENVPEDTRKQMRSLLCATAESLALAAKTELELEARVPADAQDELVSVD